MDRQVTPPMRITPPTWGPPPLCKQALFLEFFFYLFFFIASKTHTEKKQKLHRINKVIKTKNKQIANLHTYIELI